MGLQVLPGLLPQLGQVGLRGRPAAGPTRPPGVWAAASVISAACDKDSSPANSAAFVSGHSPSRSAVSRACRA